MWLVAILSQLVVVPRAASLGAELPLVTSHWKPFTPTVAAWGSVLRGFYGAGSTSRLDDTSLNTIGYTTDNGAQLCFGCQGPLDACLPEFGDDTKGAM